jgi:putative DNA primase/helicase
LKTIMGDYATPIQSEMLLNTRRNDHPNEFLQLMGRRFVLASEVSPTASWNEARVKMVTGDQEIASKKAGGEWFRFLTEAKLTVAANHLPALASVGKGNPPPVRLRAVHQHDPRRGGGP